MGYPYRPGHPIREEDTSLEGPQTGFISHHPSRESSVTVNEGFIVPKPGAVDCKSRGIFCKSGEVRFWRSPSVQVINARDVRKISVETFVVETVTDNEFITDLKADMIHFTRNSERIRFK